MKPAILVHRALGGFEAQLHENYDVLHWPQDEARAADVTAYVTVGVVPTNNEQIAQLPNLKLVMCISAGYESVDIEPLRKRGIALTNAGGVNADDVADIAMGLMISAARDVALGDRLVRAGEWRDHKAPWPRRFSGRKLGIVSYGAIGRAIAERAEGFRMEIAWTGPRAKPDVPYRYEPDLIALARWADILAVSTPGMPETDKMINASVMEALGSEGILINVGRGTTLDEDALFAALKNKTLGAAGLDVFEDEPTDGRRWADVQNITLTPHIAGGSQEVLRDLQLLILENLRRFFAGEPLKARVV